MDAEEFIARLTPVVDYRGTAAAAQAEPLLQWFRVLCTRILEEPHPAVVALEQRYNPERDLNKVRGRRDVVGGHGGGCWCENMFCWGPWALVVSVERRWRGAGISCCGDQREERNSKR